MIKVLFIVILFPEVVLSQIIYDLKTIPPTMEIPYNVKVNASLYDSGSVNLKQYNGDLWAALYDHQGESSLKIYVPNGIYIQKHSMCMHDSKKNRPELILPDNLIIEGENRLYSIIRHEAIIDHVNPSKSFHVEMNSPIAPFPDSVVTCDDTLFINSASNYFEVGDEVRINESGKPEILCQVLSSTKDYCLLNTQLVWGSNNNARTETYSTKAKIDNAFPLIAIAGYVTLRNITFDGMDGDSIYQNDDKYHHFIDGRFISKDHVSGIQLFNRFIFDNVAFKNNIFGDVVVFGNTTVRNCWFERLIRGLENSTISTGCHIFIDNCDFVEIPAEAVYMCTGGPKSFYKVTGNRFYDVGTCVAGMGTDGSQYSDKRLSDSRLIIDGNTAIGIHACFFHGIPFRNHSVIIKDNIIDRARMGIVFQGNWWASHVFGESRPINKAIIQNNIMNYCPDSLQASRFEEAYKQDGWVSYGTAPASSRADRYIPPCGLFIDAARNVIIKDNIISGFNIGIDILNVNGGILKDNTITEIDSLELHFVTEDTIDGKASIYTGIMKPSVGIRFRNGESNIPLGENNIYATKDTTWIHRDDGVITLGVQQY